MKKSHVMNTIFEEGKTHILCVFFSLTHLGSSIKRCVFGNIVEKGKVLRKIEKCEKWSEEEELRWEKKEKERNWEKEKSFWENIWEKGNCWEILRKTFMSFEFSTFSTK